MILIILIVLSGLPFKFIKDTYYPEPINVSVNVTPEIIYIEKIITVTPTPDGNLYFASEYQEGIRKIKRPFSWSRTNVTGFKDMSVHALVYDYRVMDSYHWFNPSDYKYYIETPSNPDNKFVFVFINIYMDNILGDDTRMWLPDEKHYLLQAQNVRFHPIDFEKQIRIKEFEDVYNYNDDYRVGYYGTFRYTSRSINYASTAGETYENLTYLRGGKSNAIDGYIVFEIPKVIDENELILSANFFQFGNAAWKLKVDEKHY